MNANLYSTFLLCKGHLKTKKQSQKRQQTNKTNSRPSPLRRLPVALAAGLLAGDAVAGLEVEGVFPVRVLGPVVLQDGDVVSYGPRIPCVSGYHSGGHKEDLRREERERS